MSFSLVERIILLVCVAASLGYFGYQIFRRMRIVMAAKADSEHEPVGTRIARFIFEVIFQTKVIKDRPFVGLMHALVFWGFMAWMIATLNHFLSPFFGSFLVGGIAEIYEYIVMVFSALVLVSILGLAFRRFVMPPEYFEKKISYTSGVVAVLISTLMVTKLLEPVFAGDLMSAKINWWIHACSVLIFLVVIPNSKHLHLVIGPFDLIFKRKKFGFLAPLNIEELTEDSVLGIGKPAHLSREMRMDAFSCVECGRCTENCPANGSDKILDPRSMIHKYEEPLLNGSDESIFEGGIKPEAVWQCVTCGACEYFCPLGIEHLPLILQMRRHLALEMADMPGQLQNCFKALQIKRNVWNVDTQNRSEYIEELGLPVHEKGKVLIWSSCFFLTDTYRDKVVRFVELLQKAGVDAGISPMETCCGDPARKAGGEDTFQELAFENIAWMKESGVETIVSMCPHCLQTIKDGYPQVDPEFDVEIIHHTEYLNRLVKEGKLKIRTDVQETATIHDPCYVSRWGLGDMKASRDFAGGTGVSLTEMKKSGHSSFCCGSGGGAHHFFEDEDQKRIDTKRVEQIVATGADSVITACPFCYDMVNEGLKAVDASMKVRDITSLLE